MPHCHTSARAAAAIGFAIAAFLGPGPAAAEPLEETERATAVTETAPSRIAVAAAHASADLEIYAYTDGTIGTGDPFDLYIELYNYGPDTATAVTFVDTLPAGATFDSIKQVSSGTACSHNTSLVTCTTASIAEDDGAFVIIRLIAPLVDGTITNHVAITAQTPADPYPADNSDTTTISVRSDADVYVYQTAANVTVSAPTATFHVYVGNEGPKPALNVTLTVHLPVETAYVAHVAPAGMACTPAEHTLTCTMTSLPRMGWDDDPFHLSVTVGSLLANGILTSVAEVSAASPADSNLDNNQDAEVVIVGTVPQADLYAFADWRTAVVGTSVALQSEVYNDGPQAATGVEFTDTLPAELTFVSASVAGGTCQETAGTVTCTLGTLAADAFKTVNVTVTPTQVGSFKHRVNVSATTGPIDPDPDGNADSGTVKVLPAGSTNLFVDSTGPATVLAGAEARYSFVVWNDGPSALSAATLTGTLPNEVDWVGATAPAGVVCSYDGGTRQVSCALGALAVDSGRTFDLILSKATPGTLSAVFTAPYELDIDPYDNTTQVGSTVVAAGTASISGFWWTQSSFTPQGIPMRLRFGARNAGPAAAQGATASVTIPAGVTFVSASSPYGTCDGPTAGVVTCPLGAIPADDARAASVVVTPTALGAFLVTGSVALQAPSIDPSSSNNGLSIGATIVPAVVSAPSASMPGAQIVTDPATGEVQVIASWNAIGPLTLGVSAQCPGGGPIGANPVRFLQAGLTRTATPVGARFETTYPSSQVDEGRFYGLVQCSPAPTNTQNRIGTVGFFDPLGTVRNAVTSQPISGATVSLYRVPGWTPRQGAYQNAVASTCESSASKPAGAAWSQAAPTAQGVLMDERSGYIDPLVNPETTNTAGEFGWYPSVSGCWYVVVQKPGFATATSPVMGFGEDDFLEALNVTLQPVFRTLTVTASAGGSVSSTPAGITCPTDCSEIYPDGTTVSLFASPSAGWTTSWTGACASATGNECVVTLLGNATAGVTFTPPPPPPDVTAPTVTLKIPAQRRTAVIRSGLVTSVGTNEACTLSFEVRLAAATARKLGLPVVIGTATKTRTAAGSGRVAVKLKPAAKRKLARLASLRVTVVVTAKDAAGNSRKTSRAFTIRR